MGKLKIKLLQQSDNAPHMIGILATMYLHISVVWYFATYSKYLTHIFTQNTLCRRDSVHLEDVVLVQLCFSVAFVL